MRRLFGVGLIQVCDRSRVRVLLFALVSLIKSRRGCAGHTYSVEGTLMQGLSLLSSHIPFPGFQRPLHIWTVEIRFLPCRRKWSLRHMNVDKGDRAWDRLVSELGRQLNQEMVDVATFEDRAAVQRLRLLPDISSQTYLCKQYDAALKGFLASETPSADFDASLTHLTAEAVQAVYRREELKLTSWMFDDNPNGRQRKPLCVTLCVSLKQALYVIDHVMSNPHLVSRVHTVEIRPLRDAALFQPFCVIARVPGAPNCENRAGVFDTLKKMISLRWEPAVASYWGRVLAAFKSNFFGYLGVLIATLVLCLIAVAVANSTGSPPKGISGMAVCMGAFASFAVTVLYASLIEGPKREQPEPAFHAS